MSKSSYTVPRNERENKTNTAVRYWYSDGLPDLGLGLGFWLMTAVFLNLGRVPGIAGRMVALPLTGFAISLLFPWCIRTVRKRWLPDPPIQYAPRPSLRYQFLGLIILVPLVIVLALLVARLGESPATLVGWPAYTADLFALSVGVFVSFVPLLLGFVSGAVRYYLVALPIILATLALVIRSNAVPEPGLSIVFVWGLTGFCFLLSGCVGLWRIKTLPS